MTNPHTPDGKHVYVERGPDGEAKLVNPVVNTKMRGNMIDAHATLRALAHEHLALKDALTTELKRANLAEARTSDLTRRLERADRKRAEFSRLLYRIRACWATPLLPRDVRHSLKDLSQ